MKAKTVSRAVQGLAMVALILALAGQAMAFGNVAKGEVIKVKGIEAEVYFSPRGGAEDAIVREINQARQWVMVQAYSFTSAPIGKALVEAQKRGVQVAVILDRGQVHRSHVLEERGGKGAHRHRRWSTAQQGHGYRRGNHYHGFFQLFQAGRG